MDVVTWATCRRLALLALIAVSGVARADNAAALERVSP
jgi:hypothetical protein